MADGHYRTAELVQQPQPGVPAEIYVNKDFIPRTDQWCPVDNFTTQVGLTTGMYNNVSVGIATLSAGYYIIALAQFLQVGFFYRTNNNCCHNRNHRNNSK